MSQAPLPALAPDALAGRVILVTGAGARVVLLGRTIAKLEATAEAIADLDVQHLKPRVFRPRGPPPSKN